MEIRPATAADRGPVFDICRRTYPDGDYVEDVWDTWLADGGAHVICQEGRAVCTFNTSMRDGQGWVEGTRVHPDFRRRRVGTAVLEYAEGLVRRNGGRVVRSLIEADNAPSIARAEKAGWERQDLWGWYRLGPGAAGGSFVRTEKRSLNCTRYADSWRIYDLDGTQSTVFFRGSAAAVIPARYFADTVIATVLDAEDLSEMAAFLHSLDAGAKEMRGWSSGIHITSSCEESLFEGSFERISSYYLMEKRIL